MKLLHANFRRWRASFCTMALGLLICWLFAASWVTSAAPFEQQCLSFQPTLLVPNSQLNVLQYVPAGTNLTFPGNDLSCARPSQVVTADLCRVALSIKTSNRSSIIFEQWLPQSWTGRFLATGNGVLDGCKSCCVSPRMVSESAVQVFITKMSSMGHATALVLWEQITATMALVDKPS